MERKITDLEEQIFKCKERLSQLDMDMDPHQGIYIYSQKKIKNKKNKR